MKKFFLFLLPFFVVIICTNLQAQRLLSADQVLEKVSKRLNNIKTVQYDYHRIDNYPSDNYRGELFYKIYLDYKDSLNALGFTFQATDTASSPVDIYNGADHFNLSKKEMTVSLIHNSSANSMSSMSFFLNSIVSLRKGLPTIITDNTIEKTLNDTLIDGKEYYLVNFILKNEKLKYLGTMLSFIDKRDFKYEIAIDKITYLPLFLKSSGAGQNDYNMSIFSNYDFDYKPQAASWKYTTYEPDYKEKQTQSKLKLISENTGAPDWTLAIYGTNDSLKLSSLKGKVILLDFWFRYCENCIAALPALDSIYQKYKGKNFEIIGVNLLDSKESIKAFYKVHHSPYNSVMDSDGKIATQYGVNGCPAEFVIDETGKVIYSSEGFDKKAIEDVLNAHVK